MSSRPLEVLNTSGKDPATRHGAKLTNVKRDYDKSVRGYVYVVEKSGTATGVALPADSKRPRESFAIPGRLRIPLRARATWL